MHHSLSHQVYLLEIYKSLSAANTSIRACIKENKIFRNLKCRPCIYQKTRWLGGQNLLFSAKKAYERGAFNGDIKCPIKLDVIEMYIQVLMPAYLFTLGMEKNRSSIGDVIPAVLRLIHIWDKMEVNDAKVKELCFFLIHFTRIKYKYELESPVYQVRIVCLQNNFKFS